MYPYLFSLVTLGLVLLAHVAGMESLYYQYPFFDIVPHFLGGVGIGFFGYGIAKSFYPNSREAGKFAILFTIFAGLVWELFEIFYHISGYPLWTREWYLDTIGDLILDTLGAVFAILFMKFFDLFSLLRK